MSAPTGGDWKALTADEANALFGNGAFSGPVVVTDEPDPWFLAEMAGGIPEDERMANAELMASAPALLREVQQLRRKP